MIEQLLESPVLGWPVALTCASVLAAERVRSARRRTRLNRCLHELRRPLQALLLDGGRASHVELAVEALADLDRALNGGSPPPPRAVPARRLVEAAVARWRPIAARSGRRIDLSWSANGSLVICRPNAIGAALDNLIANALEHGAGPVRIEAGVTSGRLRLRVVDSGGGGRDPVRRRKDPRRGHGLQVVARIAAEHGGRFVACRERARTSAVIELPLATPLPPAA